MTFAYHIIELEQVANEMGLEIIKTHEDASLENNITCHVCNKDDGKIYHVGSMVDTMLYISLYQEIHESYSK